MNIINLNEENFIKEISKNELFLICFFRPDCRACHNIFPVLEELSTSFKVGFINIYENENIAIEYKIPAVPTLIIFKNGNPIEKAVGVRSKEVLENKLKSLK